jgi:hypothetical protein
LELFLAEQKCIPKKSTKFIINKKNNYFKKVLKNGIEKWY